MLVCTVWYTASLHACMRMSMCLFGFGEFRPRAALQTWLSVSRSDLDDD